MIPTAPEFNLLRSESGGIASEIIRGWISSDFFPLSILANALVGLTSPSIVQVDADFTFPAGVIAATLVARRCAKPPGKSGLIFSSNAVPTASITAIAEAQPVVAVVVLLAIALRCTNVKLVLWTLLDRSVATVLSTGAGAPAGAVSVRHTLRGVAGALQAETARSAVFVNLTQIADLTVGGLGKVDDRTRRQRPLLCKLDRTTEHRTAGQHNQDGDPADRNTREEAAKQAPNLSSVNHRSHKRPYV